MAYPVEKVRVYNIKLESGDTEYSQLLPSSTRNFRFKCRSNIAIRYAFETGKVAASVAPFMTLKAGDEYVSYENDLTALTIYFAASNQDDPVIELEVWTQ